MRLRLSAFCRRLHRDDASHGVAFRQRLADEQVNMGLQEAAGAELDDRERHVGQISISALITPVSGLIHSGKRAGDFSSEARWVASASSGRAHRASR